MALASINELFDILSGLQLDITDKSNNAVLLSTFDKLIDSAVDFITDHSTEGRLLDELLQKRDQQNISYDEAINQANQSLHGVLIICYLNLATLELELEYSKEEEVHARVSSELAILRSQTKLGECCEYYFLYLCYRCNRL